MALLQFPGNLYVRPSSSLRIGQGCFLRGVGMRWNNRARCAMDGNAVIYFASTTKSHGKSAVSAALSGRRSGPRLKVRGMMEYKWRLSWLPRECHVPGLF